jgi:hypothetical protein
VTTFNDLDFGPSHSWLKTRIGQVTGGALVSGFRTLTWAGGATAEEQSVDIYVNAWQGLGGNAANTRGSLLYLLRQLEELAGNSDLQPIYIAWTTTAAPGAYSAADLHDGWYVVTLVEPPYGHQTVTGGVVTVPASVTLVASGAPSSLSAWYAGGALATTYVGLNSTPFPLVGFPIGSSGQPPTTLSRTGAEGAIPLSYNPAANPVPFVRPNTIAGLWTGGVRVLDTINTSSNPVPTSGGFLHANWVQVYGTQHAFQGDVVVTNGLVLLLFQAGVGNVCLFYVWNTSLGTPAWQLISPLWYKDNSFNISTLREINLERVGWEEARVRVVAGTSAGHWAQLRLKLQRGSYVTSVEFMPRTQTVNTPFALALGNLQSAAKIDYSDTGIVDAATSPTVPVAVSTAFGFGASISQVANWPLVGWTFQNPPSTSQGISGSTSELATGDGNVVQGSFTLYGFFALPWTTAPNLQAEAEGGTLGTGWSSVADATASAGNAAKAASGTASTNADLFGTSWVPAAGMYDVWFRVRVTSAAGSSGEMTLGLWDATSSAFVGGGSTTFAANAASTSYVWLKANGTSPLTPTAGHNMRFRAVTAGTLGTDWFIDEAVLAPIRSTSPGADSFPGDAWLQWAFDKTVSWSRG